MQVRANISNTHKPKSFSLASSIRRSSFFAPQIQLKLTINQPDDMYEQEADAVAEKTMRMPDSTTKPLFFKPKPFALSSMQRKCSHCIEEEGKMQMKRESCSGAAMTAPSLVHNVINSNGQPMDATTRNFMESRFGYDFGNVQIHNNSLAHRSSSEINALAYTHGSHVVFGEGQYQPNTNSGKRLLAHELTHVVQQLMGIQRSIAYDAKGKEEHTVNPAINIRDKQFHMGKTKPTLNKNEMKKDNPLSDPKYSFTDGACQFADVKDTLSYTMSLPIKTDWKTMITIDQAKNMLAPRERDKLACDLGQIPLVVKGDPDDKSRSEEIRKHELGHVSDLKKLYNSILLPWSKAFTDKVSKGGVTASKSEDCLKEFYKNIGSKNDVYKKFVSEFFVLDANYHASSAGATAQPRNQQFTCKKIEFKL